MYREMWSHSSGNLTQILIITLLIRISVADKLGQTKLVKVTDGGRLPHLHTRLDRAQEYLMRITREVASDPGEETTLQPQMNESSPSFFNDDVEHSRLPNSVNSEVNANENGPGLNRLLEFLEKHKYNAYEIPKLNRTRLGKDRQYDPPLNVHPGKGNPETYPVDVEMHILIHSVSDIDEINESVSLDVDILTSWCDGKLNNWFRNSDHKLQEEYRETWPDAKESVPLESKTLDKFWIPDITIERLAKVTTSTILAKSEGVRFNLLGEFNYLKRVTVKVNCELDFTYYPADTQKCDFILSSYSYNSSDMTLSWAREGVYLKQTADANFVMQIHDVVNNSFSIGMTRECLKCDNSTENGTDALDEGYEYLRFTLHMRRRIYYQLLQTYIPSTLYIAITWLCFMIPPRMIEVRLAISMTTLLTLTSMFASVRENTPTVSYIKAIDVWMAAGIVSIFVILLEFTILLWTQAVKKEQEALERKARKKRGGKRESDTESSRDKLPLTFRKEVRKLVHAKASIAIDIVEEYSSEIILIVTTSFNISYWTWLFVGSGYYSWSLDDEYNANAGCIKYDWRIGQS